MERKGTFYFFTGLAGAGKSTIGGLFYRKLKAQRNDVLLFDGDVTRMARQEADYSNEGRLESCRRSMGMYKLITDQGIDIVCCAIAMFEEVPGKACAVRVSCGDEVAGTGRTVSAGRQTGPDLYGGN